MKFDLLLKKDIPRILELERICFAHPWPQSSFREVLSSKTFQTLAARTRSKYLIGYTVFTEVVDELHVLNVAVDPNYRRYGIATTMLAHVHIAAAHHGRAYAYLEVRESNLPAQKLYAKFGYKPLTKRRDYYSENHEDAILMGTPLHMEENI